MVIRNYSRQKNTDQNRKKNPVHQTLFVFQTGELENSSANR